MLNRRQMLAAPAAATVVVSRGETSLSPDAELVEIGARWNIIAPQADAALQHFNRACERAHKEALKDRQKSGAPFSVEQVLTFEDRYGVEAADVAYEKLRAELTEMQERAATLTATTAAGLRTKALIAYWERKDLPALDLEISEGVGDLIRNVLAMGAN